jgi:hypothetical protein
MDSPQLAYQTLESLLPDPHQTWIWENGGDRRGYDVAHLTGNSFYVRKGLPHKKALAVVAALTADALPEVAFEHKVEGILLLNITELRWSEDANRVEIHRRDGKPEVLKAKDRTTHHDVFQALWQRLAPIQKPEEVRLSGWTSLGVPTVGLLVTLALGSLLIWWSAAAQASPPYTGTRTLLKKVLEATLEWLGPQAMAGIVVVVAVAFGAWLFDRLRNPFKAKAVHVTIG